VGEYDSLGGGPLGKQDVEAFLDEMMVVGEDFCKTFAPHRLHSDTIGQAIFLVGPCFVERQRIKQGRTRLWQHRPLPIAQRIPHRTGSMSPDRCSGGTTRGKKLSQHLIDGIQVIVYKRPAERQNARAPLVSGVRKSNQIKRIGFPVATEK
jgi:hypothetical protein